MKIARYFAVALAMAWAVLASQPTYAQMLTCDSSVTLTEGASGHINCTYDNNTSGAITINPPSAPLAAEATIPPVGDATDIATSTAAFSGSGSSPCTAGEILSAGSSCQFAVLLTTDNPAGETDNDSGFQTWAVVVNPGGFVPGRAEADLSVTVNDPSPTSAPEPSSLALIFLGLGALLLMRKRIGQRSPSVV